MVRQCEMSTTRAGGVLPEIYMDYLVDQHGSAFHSSQRVGSIYFRYHISVLQMPKSRNLMPNTPEPKVGQFGMQCLLLHIAFDVVSEIENAGSSPLGVGFCPRTAGQ